MNIEALNVENRGDLVNAIQLFQSGAVDQAMHICHHLLTRNPNHPDAHQLMGLIELERGRFSAARSRLAQALSIAPDRAEFHNDMGLVLMAMERYDEALASFQAALDIEPRMVGAHYNRGLAQKAMSDHHSAAKSFITTLQCDPGHPKAHFSIGELLLSRREFVGAEKHFQAAIKSNPNYVAAFNHLAICLSEQERVEESRRLLHQAMDIDPLCASTHCNLGNLARQSYNFQEAIRCYREALRLQPDFIEAHFNLGVILLLLGDFESGWQEYEWRLRLFPPDSGYPNRHGLPLWEGQSIKGKTILVYDEQGFGDVFMFTRYLPMLKAHGARVVFETRPPLFDLYKKMPYIDQMALRHWELPLMRKCDYCIPLLSLPGRFGTNRKGIGFDAPYLFADAQRTEHWACKMYGEGFKIGLVWHGSDIDRSRHCDLDRLSVLSDLPGIQWYGLQQELPSLSKAQDYWLIHLGCEFNDFADTAAAIANLDLVITIDTAVAHLAGAMGKQVWVLLPFVPDWRWFLDDKTTPWYAGMRLYRQPASGDWDTPITAIINDLKQWMERRNRRVSDESIQSLHASALELHRKHAFAEAESLYCELLAIAPEHHGVAASLGLLYLQAGRYDDAVETLLRTMRLKPDDALSMNNLGYAFHRLGHLERAVLVYFSAIAVNPDYANTYHNLGNVFLDMQDMEATIVCYAKALDLNPQDARAQCEMGKLLLKKLDLAGARTHFQRSIDLSPEDTEARVSLATTALMQGDFSTGWHHYQWRFKARETRNQTYPHRFELPLWRGEPFPGKRLLVHCEQGFGDTIQFSRFLPQVKALGGEVTFQLQAQLRPLFRHFPGVDSLDLLADEQTSKISADLYVPLMDLPLCLGVTLETIPAKPSYLEPDRNRIIQWRGRIGAARFKIGVVWAGNRHHINDHNRSCRLEDMRFIGEYDRAMIFSLQKDVTESDRHIISRQSAFTHIGDALNDFGDTAAAIACLDLVITVDTAIAHLAGAMGKPTWVLLPYLPDWRWMTARDDSPWYPTMRLFRQPAAGKWGPVMDAVRQALEEEFDGV